MDRYKIEEPGSTDTPEVGMPRDLGAEPHVDMVREAVRESLAKATPPGYESTAAPTALEY
jgi:hypothetical protein